MAKWEYCTIRINYDRKKLRDWLVERPQGPPLVGLQAILESYGSGGWELVNLSAERLEAYPTFARWHLSTTSYRATFKRSHAA